MAARLISIFAYIRQFLFSPSVPLGRYCLIAFPLILIPSATISLMARQIFQWAGVNVDLISAPERQVSLSEFLGSVLFAPVVETLLLSLTIAVLSSLTSRTFFVAMASGIVWGCVHGAFGFLWFFGTAWSFFVFSCAYLHWRKQSYGQGFLSAAIPHAMLNLAAMLALAIVGGST